MHAFLNNLPNRQTDKHHGQSHLPPPLSEVISYYTTESIHCQSVLQLFCVQNITQK